jgi:hypothetical protein
MDRLNSHFLRPLQLAPRVISGDSQSTLVDRLGVSPSRSRLLTSPHRISSGGNTTGLGPQCWDVSLIASQQPVCNLQLVRAGTQNYLICAGKLCHCARSNWGEIMCSKKVPLTKHTCAVVSAFLHEPVLFSWELMEVCVEFQSSGYSWMKFLVYWCT